MNSYMNDQLIHISVEKQQMTCYFQDIIWQAYSVSSGKKGVGELKNSECTPRGWHRIHACIGMGHEENSVFVARNWTGEIYDVALAANYPDRDWILTRILQLDGLEPGRNKGGNVDSLQRFIYIHGTPESSILGIPGSHGCIRMGNKDIIELANWVKVDTHVYIE